MTQSQPAGYPALTPSLTFKDTRKAVAYYEKALGAKLIDLLSAPDGRGTMHATMRIGDSMIMMGDEGFGCKSSETMGGSPMSLYLYVPDVDAVYANAIAAGGTADMPVTEMFWGDRAGNFKDPFGYSWMVATKTGELMPAQITEGAVEFFKAMGQQ